MAKSLKEVGDILRQLIINMNNDAHNSRGFNAERYNNMKITMDPSKEIRPHVTITIGMSESTYSLDTQMRLDGSLGADERYIARWFNRSGVLDALKDLWREQSRKDKEQIDGAQLENIDELKQKREENKKDN